MQHSFDNVEIGLTLTVIITNCRFHFFAANGYCGTTSSKYYSLLCHAMPKLQEKFFRTQPPILWTSLELNYFNLNQLWFGNRKSPFAPKIFANRCVRDKTQTTPKAAFTDIVKKHCHYSAN